MRQVTLAAITIATGDQHLPHRSRPGQVNRFRIDNQSDRLADERLFFFRGVRPPGGHQREGQTEAGNGDKNRLRPIFHGEGLF